MSFKSLQLNRTYNSTNVNIIKNVINDILKDTVKYDREVGFFSSSWLKEVAHGLSHFIGLNNGKARIITSIKLSEQDREVFYNSANVDEDIENRINQVIQNSIEDLEKQLEYDTLNILGTLVKSNILEFKFAIPVGSLQGGMFHSKISIFYDNENNHIVISGSQNDSYQASINEETVTLFTNFGEGKLYALDLIETFEKKWNNNIKNLKIYTLPETIKNNIIQLATDYSNSSIYTINNKKHMKQERILRDYQAEAIDEWTRNHYIGFFEMATGAGKTFTAISATKILYEKYSKIAMIVIVPYQHLAQQWIKELKDMDYKPIACFGSINLWENNLHNKINMYINGFEKKLCIVTLYASASRDEFQNIINTRLKNIDYLIIADEAHNTGSSMYRKTLFSSAKFRIGLSATPIRWYDDIGTNIIKDYFKKTVIEYPIERAIKENKLTPYYYEPILIDLTEDELEEFIELSDKISNLTIINDKTEFDNELLKKLLIKRSMVIAKAENKKISLQKLVKEHIKKCHENYEEYKYNIFYVANEQTKCITKILSDIGLKVHEFVGTMNMQERASVIQSFSNGEIDGIVAIKCLDEGVDIPATKRAYILSSTTNPKEFIQRRGRILRIYSNKIRAYIYDFMVGPWKLINNVEDKYLKKLLIRELPRFAEFNSCAENKASNRQLLASYCEHYGFIDELDKTPYDIYNESKLLIEDNDLYGDYDG